MFFALTDAYGYSVKHNDISWRWEIHVWFCHFRSHSHENLMILEFMSKYIYLEFKHLEYYCIGTDSKHIPMVCVISYRLLLCTHLLPDSRMS